MFVTERKADDVFLFDGGIKIKVLKITQNKVKIGIETPENIRITVSDSETQNGKQVVVHEQG